MLLTIILSGLTNCYFKLKVNEEREVNLDLNYIKGAIVNYIDEVPSLKDSIRNEVSKYGFKYPKYILAQIYIESGDLTSNVFKKNNNLFGMKVAKSRLSILNDSTSTSSYCKYDHWRYSIIDRALYEATFLHSKKEVEYFKCLGTFYAEDTKYLEKLKSVATNIEKYF